MALYEYVCSDCGTSFELRRAMGDGDRAVTCPSGHTEVRRKLSVFASVGRGGERGHGPARPDQPSRRVLRWSVRLRSLTAGYKASIWPDSAVCLVRHGLICHGQARHLSQSISGYTRGKSADGSPKELGPMSLEGGPDGGAQPDRPAVVPGRGYQGRYWPWVGRQVTPPGDINWPSRKRRGQPAWAAPVTTQPLIPPNFARYVSRPDLTPVPVAINATPDFLALGRSPATSSARRRRPWRPTPEVGRRPPMGPSRTAPPRA